MKRLEDLINDEVNYWVDEFEEDDYNIFKLEVEEDFNIDILDDKLLSEYIISLWQDRNYLYFELDYSMLLDNYNTKMQKWKEDFESLNYEYWNDRGL
jgi:hypothetical protein